MIRPTPIVTLLAATHARSVAAFHVLPPYVTIARPGRSYSTVMPSAVVLRGLLGFGDDEPKEGVAPIPPELLDDIYSAEAKTTAAQGRQLRTAGYVVLTLLGLTIGFFNAFLTELLYSEEAPSTELGYYGFGWVEANSILNFLFRTTPGGLFGLLGAGLSGTLAEVEIRSKDENAAEIWAEMQRRKALKETPAKTSRKKKRKKEQRIAPSSKKDMTGKQRKRLSALKELMVEEGTPATAENTRPMNTEPAASEPKESAAAATEEDEGGVLGKIKGFYKQADSMAASQALLLNKELEERGIVDKITDESGLRVIGKEAAAVATEKRASSPGEE